MPVVFTARHYVSAAYAVVVVCLSVRPSQLLQSGVYRNDWTDRDAFGRGCFLSPIVLPRDAMHPRY